MFENLSDKILGSIKKIRGQARITETNIEDAIAEIRRHFLEADVNFKVVKIFIDRVKARALGQVVSKGLSAGQEFVGIVHDELTHILGREAVELDIRKTPAVVFLVGLQGSGKTTSAAKLALFIRNKFGKKPGLVSVDIYRPAAIEQLQILARANGVPVFESDKGEQPEKILARARSWVAEQMIDVLIVDTAGRTQIEEDLMSELVRLKDVWQPVETLLVADAMLGQQSVNVATGFHDRVGLTGMVLTKMDGDARGGAALSVRETIGIPIKFLGVGEKASQLEVFHPDRLANRILDMGDVLSLVERAQEVISEEEAQKTAHQIRKNSFSLDDFLAQIQMMKKMGGMESIMKMIPGMGQALKKMKGLAPPEAEVKKIEAIIRSMTHKERRNHKILNGSRRARIAQGSGTRVQDVNHLIRQFEQAQKMMSQMMKMGGGQGRLR